MRILVIGGARSGTSWVGTMLGGARGAGYLREPDNHGTNPYAARALRCVGTLPILHRDEPGPPDLRRLWDVAFGAPIRSLPGQRRLATWLYVRAFRNERLEVASRDDRRRGGLRLRFARALAVPRTLPAGTEHRVVKSIRAQLMLEWIDANWNPAVVVCRRHPLDVVASRLELGLGATGGMTSSPVRGLARARYGAEYPRDEDRVASVAWRVALEMSVLDEALAARPEYRVVDHEELCADPVGRFRLLAGDLGLDWTPENDAMVVASNRPGSGYELNRVAAQVPGSWRRRLSVEDARTAARVLARFPVAGRYDLAVV